MNLVSIPVAIAREEGWFQFFSRCRRNNNPGNIEFAAWTKEFGAELESSSPARFASFPSSSAGFAALRTLLGFPRYKGRSLADAIANWAPPVENETSEYLKNVCTWTGLTEDTIIDDHLGEAIDDPD